MRRAHKARAAHTKMPCTECGALLLSAAFANTGHRYATECPQCNVLCIYVPEDHGMGNVKLTAEEIQVIKKIFGDKL